MGSEFQLPESLSQFEAGHQLIEAGKPTSTAEPGLIALLLADKRSVATRQAYRSDLLGFFGGEPSPEKLKAFLGQGAPQIALSLATYKGQMLEKGLSEATVNRRLAAVRSLLTFSYRLGHSATDGRGLVDGEKSRAYRDTRGTDIHTLRRLVALLGTETLIGLRDTALLRLLCENALRRAEVCTLDVADFGAESHALYIVGKGRGTQRAARHRVRQVRDGRQRLPPGIRARGGSSVSRRWITGLRIAKRTTRCAWRPNGLYKINRQYGKQLGLSLAPAQAAPLGDHGSAGLDRRGSAACAEALAARRSSHALHLRRQPQRLPG